MCFGQQTLKQHSSNAFRGDVLHHTGMCMYQCAGLKVAYAGMADEGVSAGQHAPNKCLNTTQAARRPCSLAASCQLLSTFVHAPHLCCELLCSAGAAGCRLLRCCQLKQ